MLQNTDERVAYCLHRAAGAQARAREAMDPAIRRCFVRLAESWRTLSQSEEFAERLARFCASRPALGRPERVNIRPSNLAHVDVKHAREALVAIVDDDRWAREGMNSFVASLGYFGATFMSAEDYLGSDLKQLAGCLILDVHLCGMSGPDLQARLLADGYRTPVIFVSAQSEDHVRDRVMKAGALGYFTKPWDERALINCLERAVGG